MVTAAPAAPRRRLGAWLILVALSWAAGTLWLFSDGALSVYVDMVILYVGAALVGAAAITTLVLGGRHGDDQTRPGGWRRWSPLVFTAVLVGAIPSLCRYGVPFSLRLRWSEQALLAVASAGAGASTSPGWIGALHVTRIDRQQGVTRFTTGACGLAERCGIAHVAEGTPAPTEELTYKRVRGPWWAFEQR